MISSMRTIRGPRRWVATSIALLLFVAGSNFCVIAALAGDSMSCLAAPNAAPSESSHCPAHPAGKTGATTPATSPCCTTLAPVSTVTVAKGDVTPAAQNALPCEWLDRPTTVTGRTAPIPDESPPRLAELPAPSRERAPPIS